MPDRRLTLELRTLGAIAVVVGGFLITLFAAWVYPARVTTQEQLRGPLEFGFPFPWVTQWTPLDPPLPANVSMGTPLETPTETHWDVFWLDVLLVTGGLGLIVLGVSHVSRVLHRRRQSLPSRASQA